MLGELSRTLAPGTPGKGLACYLSNRSATRRTVSRYLKGLLFSRSKGFDRLYHFRPHASRTPHHYPIANSQILPSNILFAIQGSNPNGGPTYSDGLKKPKGLDRPCPSDDDKDVLELSSCLDGLKLIGQGPSRCPKDLPGLFTITERIYLDHHPIRFIGESISSSAPIFNEFPYRLNGLMSFVMGIYFTSQGCQVFKGFPMPLHISPFNRSNPEDPYIQWPLSRYTGVPLSQGSRSGISRAGVKGKPAF